jgi:GT2 family glycosyltransferase
MPPASPQIYAVIVLYNQEPSKSQAVLAFTQALQQGPALNHRFRLLLYDNSAAAGDAESLFEYRHDPRNEGLATAYNYALERAIAEDSQWLLLLDQDTAVTLAYLQEVLALTLTLDADQRVGAIVPKLESAKGIKSPTLDFLEWLRRQMQFPRKRALFATREMYGLQEEQFSAFNSASVLRVAALQKIGGFPPEFWLDFLDIAVFHRLHGAGLTMFVMHSTLVHELSMDTKEFYEKQGGLARHRNLLAAMVRFVRMHGTPRDLWLTRAWLLRNALNLFTSARDKRFSLASLQQAFKLNPEAPRP